jgi:hypothetical protein
LKPVHSKEAKLSLPSGCICSWHSEYRCILKKLSCLCLLAAYVAGTQSTQHHLKLPIGLKSCSPFGYISSKCSEYLAQLETIFQNVEAFHTHIIVIHSL